MQEHPDPHRKAGKRTNVIKKKNRKRSRMILNKNWKRKTSGERQRQRCANHDNAMGMKREAIIGNEFDIGMHA